MCRSCAGRVPVVRRPRRRGYVFHSSRTVEPRRRGTSTGAGIGTSDNGSARGLSAGPSPSATPIMANDATPGNLTKRPEHAAWRGMSWYAVMGHNDRHPQKSLNAQERLETIGVYTMRDR